MGCAGRPLVFWHALGPGTSGAYLTEVAPDLTAAGLRLHAPDAPGFGRSPALPVEGIGRRRSSNSFAG